ncbi:MAG: hypothetical protein J6C42_08560 [Clostridia bacterium]|nr:hypothetical protein [Clostridia bacterium]MBO5257531.1 hypothetical protein [Clostridia bacterium]
MAKTIQEKNRMECNKNARKKYDKEHFKYQSVCFKIEELEEINQYCEKYGIQKNTFFREACMQYMGKSLK